jgi:hypothetical protein
MGRQPEGRKMFLACLTKCGIMSLEVQMVIPEAKEWID